MKNIYLILSLSIIAFSCNNLTNKKNRDLSNDIIDMLHSQTESWNAGSLDSFMSKGYWKSDSLQFITPKGIKLGYEKVLNGYKESYPNKAAMGHLEFNDIKVLSLDDKKSIYQVFGHWDVRKDEKSTGGFFSLIIKNINGEPKIVIDHTY